MSSTHINCRTSHHFHNNNVPIIDVFDIGMESVKPHLIDVYQKNPDYEMIVIRHNISDIKKNQVINQLNHGEYQLQQVNIDSNHQFTVSECKDDQGSIFAEIESDGETDDNETDPSDDDTQNIDLPTFEQKDIIKTFKKSCEQYGFKTIFKNNKENVQKYENNPDQQGQQEFISKMNEIAKKYINKLITTKACYYQAISVQSAGIWDSSGDYGEIAELPDTFWGFGEAMTIMANALYHSPPHIEQLISWSSNTSIIGYKLWIWFAREDNPKIYQYLMENMKNVCNEYVLSYNHITISISFTLNRYQKMGKLSIYNV